MTLNEMSVTIGKRSSLEAKLLSSVHTSNNVEATYDIVAFDNVASTLLLVWTGLYA